MKRRALWRGTVPVSAIRFSRDSVPRVIAWWRRDVQLLRDGDAIVMRFAAPRWMRAQEAPGEVFVAVSGVLTSARLDEKEAAAFLARPFVRLIEGELLAAPMPSQPVAPGELIAVDDFALADVMPLAEPARPRAAVAPDVKATARQLLGVGEASDAQREMERELEAETRGAGRGRSDGSGGGAVGAFARMLGLFAAGAVSVAASGIAGFFERLFGRRGEGAEPTRAGKVSKDGKGEPAAPEERATPIRDALRSLFNRFLLTTRLARILGEKQAAYMANLIDLLERNRFEEALRHAIPLSDKVISSLSRLTLSLPSPRIGNPTLTLFRREAPASMIGGADTSARLRELYRKAAQELEREGKIEQAAFVYADLLNLPEEAVSLLERHKMFELAAKLAEARKLPVDLIVRQWFVAGDRKRAVGLARRHEVFELAVRRLEKTHPNEAIELRIEWGESLVRKGRFAEAVDVVWDIESQRNRARQWLDIAIERGGVAGARALARRLVIIPEEPERTLAMIGGACVLEDFETAPARLALALTLQMLPESPESASAVRMALRSVVRDTARGFVSIVHRDLDVLAKRCGDPALRADLPPVAPTSSPDWRKTTSTISHAVAEADRGTSAVHDAALLEEGILAVALGEAGCVLLDRRGRTIARLEEPAYRLVVSDTLDRALALAPRGASMRIAQLDFASRQSRYWLDAKIDAYAGTYDGATWFASMGNELLAIDTTAAKLDSIWYNPDAGPIFGSIARSPKSVAFINGSRGQVWRYEIPAYVLRSRTDIEVSENASYITSPDGLAYEAAADLEANRTLFRSGALTNSRRYLREEPGFPLMMSATDDWFVVVMKSGDVVLLEPQTGRMRGRVSAPGASPAVRLQKNALTIFDALGRLVVIDLDRGTAIRDLRV